MLQWRQAIQRHALRRKDKRPSATSNLNPFCPRSRKPRPLLLTAELRIAAPVANAATGGWGAHLALAGALAVARSRDFAPFALHIGLAIFDARVALTRAVRDQPNGDRADRCFDVEPEHHICSHFGLRVGHGFHGCFACSSAGGVLTACPEVLCQARAACLEIRVDARGQVLQRGSCNDSRFDLGRSGSIQRELFFEIPLFQPALKQSLGPPRSSRLRLFRPVAVYSPVALTLPLVMFVSDEPE